MSDPFGGTPSIAPIDRARWLEAQAGERGYWVRENPVEQRIIRNAEAEQRAWYRGLLRIRRRSLAGGMAALDLGCGPSSMALDPDLGVSELYAVDPLEYDAESEKRYVDAPICEVVGFGEWNPGWDCGSVAYDRHVHRYYMPAEDYSGPQVDEVWCYNVLQHVIDPARVIQVAAFHVKRGGVLRLFDWTNVPPDTLHPHVLTHRWLHETIASHSLVLDFETVGVGGGRRHRSQSFYAGVWRRE